MSEKGLELNNSVIVAPYEYFPLLFKYKNDHPTLDVIFMTPDEVSLKLCGGYSDLAKATATLISNGIDYDKAKEYLKIFLYPFFDKEADDKLKKIRDLVKPFIRKDQYDYLFFANKNVYLLESNSDCLLKNIFKANSDLKANVIDLSLEQLGFSALECFKKPKLYYFDDKYWQFFWIFADIRKRILNNEKTANDIQILIADKTDIFYIELFSSIFKIVTFDQTKTYLFDQPEVKTQFSLFTKQGNLKIDPELLGKSKALQCLDSLIKKYELDKLEDKNYALNNLHELLQANSYKEEKVNSGIIVTDKYTFNPEVETYIANFDDNSFFVSTKDNNVLSDSYLKQLGGNASYDFTLMDKQLKFNFIKYHKCAVYSRPLQHLDDHIYDSPIAEELKWVDKKHPEKSLAKHIVFKKDKDEFKDGSNTTEAIKLYHIGQTDAEFSDKKYKAEELNTYDNSFKKFTGIPTRNEFSSSGIEKYCGCGFKYYLENILKLKPDEDKFNLVVGNALHAVFQDINHDFGLVGTDTYVKHYKDQKAAGLKAYKDSLKSNNLDFTVNDAIYWEVICSWLDKFYPIYYKKFSAIRAKGHMVEFTPTDKYDKDYELDFSFDLKDRLKGYKITGRIDKVLLTKSKTEEGEKTFYTVLDFKSGSSATFDREYIPYGKSLQLPIYFFATQLDLNLNSLLEDYQWGGLGLQRIWSKKFNDFLVDKHVANITNIDKYANARGISADSAIPQGYTESVDTNLSGKKVTPLLIDSKKDTDIEEIYDEALESIRLYVSKMINNDFDVNPIPSNPPKLPDENNELNCQYCKLRNICYINKAKYKRNYGKEN